MEVFILLTFWETVPWSFPQVFWSLTPGPKISLNQSNYSSTCFTSCSLEGSGLSANTWRNYSRHSNIYERINSNAKGCAFSASFCHPPSHPSVLAQSLIIPLQIIKPESGYWNPTMSPVDLILWTDEYTLKWKLLN